MPPSVSSRASEPPTEKASILLVDDTPANLLALRGLLEPLGENLFEARSGAAALELAAQRDFAVILLDVLMPEMDGFEVAARVRALDRARNTPILFITAAAMDEASIERGFAVGAVDYLTKPIQTEQLLAKVKSHLTTWRRARSLEAKTSVVPGERPRVLIVNDKPAVLTSIAAALEHVDAHVVTAESAQDCLRFVLKQDVALLLVDFHMPGTDGLELMRILRQNERLDRTPVVIVTATASASADIERAYAAGASEFIFLPIEPSLLRARVTALLRNVAHERRLRQQVAAIEELNAQNKTAQSALAQLNASLEEKVASQTAALRLSEQSQRALLEKIPAIVYKAALDQVGTMLYVNPQIDALGFSQAEWTAEPGRWAKQIHPEDRDRVLRDHARAAASGQPFVCEYRLLTRTGEARWVHDQSVAICDAAGAPMFQQGVMLDITDAKRLEQERDSLRTQLLHAQKMESVGRLAGGVAHDFNNLLSVILGYANLVLQAMPRDSAQAGDLEEIIAAAESAAGVTRQLLAFSRKQTIEVAPLDLNDAVRAILKLLGRLVGEDVEIVLRLAPEPAVVAADETQLAQVLVNLCVNARDAMPQGGKIIIATRATDLGPAAVAAHPGLEPGSFVALTVEDTGSGMAPAVVERAFEPFFTTKEPGRGTGLGLSTVYGIVKQHGGAITAESEVGKGTRVTIYLPRSERAPQGPRPRSEDAFYGRGETILVMEDELVLRTLVVRMLERLGFHAFPCSTAAECVELVRSEAKVDLLLTDVIMPETNGREVHERIAAVRPGIPVLFMSGYTDDIVATRGVVERGAHFIAKPFTEDLLGRKIRDVLDTAKR